MRCFSRVVVCVYITGAYEGMYLAGQHIYQHYNKAGLLPPATPSVGPVFGGWRVAWGGPRRGGPGGGAR